ncbi:hypothetical protein WMF30_26610 [Sorangium sp. So ce134]
MLHRSGGLDPWVELSSRSTGGALPAAASRALPVGLLDGEPVSGEPACAARGPAGVQRRPSVLRFHARRSAGSAARRDQPPLP